MTNTSSNHPLAQSLDLTTERLEQLKKLFPDAISEGQIDFNRLKAVLGDSTVQTSERYELSWAGKSDARREIQKRTTATLRPDTANSVNWDATQNLYIEGENLEVLRTLQKAYFGKVKLIYIDPPYNTGNDSFVYPDDYTERLAEYRARTGQTDEAGFVNKQDMWKKNTKENGQFHSVWLSMMYPRLFLARNLLDKDGIIFVSIDDNEGADLKLLMDEIFGEENFIAQICHKSRASVSNDKIISSNHNLILLYAKNKDIIHSNRSAFGLPPELDGFTKKDKNGFYKFAPVDGPGGASKGNPYYEFMGTTGYFRFSKETMQKKYDKGEVVKVGNGLQQKSYLEDAKLSRKTDTTWWDEKLYTSTATSRLNNLIGADFFSNPKPVELITRMLELHVRSENDIVLDFFSGSGTTAQAVLELNEKDGVNRNFICVQMPEGLEADNEAFKAGYKTIAEIGRARIKKVIADMEAKREIENEEGKVKQAIGFNAFKLAPSNFKEWRTDIENEEDLLAQMEYHLDSTKPDSLPQSMVYELLLKLSFPITTPMVCYEVKDTQQVYIASPTDAKPVAMFFNDVSGEITAFVLKTKPSKVVCLNKAFADSSALTNFSLQLKDADIALEVL